MELEVFGVGILAGALDQLSALLSLLFLSFYRASLTSETLCSPPLPTSLPLFSLRERRRRGEEMQRKEALMSH